MCVTTEVQGKVNLHERFQKYDDSGIQTFTEGQSQYHGFSSKANEWRWLPGQSRDVTYISRMQCVQAAVHKELEAMREKFPQYRPALVTFNHEVTIYGDGSEHPGAPHFPLTAQS